MSQVIKAEKVECPALDIDKVLYKETNGRPHPRGVLERRIMANLLAHLWANKFKVTSVFDGDEDTDTAGPQEVLELVFNLDEAWLFAIKEGEKHGHTISIVLGNGIDIISDYTFNRDDSDNFRVVMDAFNAEDYA